jgi:DNA polymerase III subunit epsilon
VELSTHGMRGIRAPRCFARDGALNAGGSQFHFSGARVTDAADPRYPNSPLNASFAISREEAIPLFLRVTRRHSLFECGIFPPDWLSFAPGNGNPMANDDSQFLLDALPETHAWPGRPGAGDIAPLPGCAAVFLFVDGQGAPVQLATTQHLKRVAASKFGESEETRRGKVDLAEIVRGVRWRRVHSPFEARWWYYRLIRVLHPRAWRREVTFGPAWFLHVDWSAPVPDIHLSERIWVQPGDFVGPWPTQKACRQALETLWDLFDLCRYPEQVRKTPRGVPCAYAEMNRCDAPCNGSVPIQVYVNRLRAAWAFAAGEIEPWLEGAARRMREAAAALRFEQAGVLKQQLDAAQRWRTQWSEKTRPAERLNYLLVIPATRRKAWKPFLFLQGRLTDGPLLPEGKLLRDLPKWLAEQRDRMEREAHSPSGTSPDAARTDDEIRMEQTWLVAHFLEYREAQSALTIPLEDGQIPPNLTELLEKLRHAPRTEEPDQPLTEESDRPPTEG